MSRIHRYEGEAVMIDFELGRCIHTGDCTRALPSVFDTKRTGRWVHPDGADARDVARVCAACPTGALRCIEKSAGSPMRASPQENTVQIVKDGPLYVHAQMHINGEVEPAHRAALCRCGASRLMPYCDGSHRGTGFQDSGRVNVPQPSASSATGGLGIHCTKGGPLLVEGSFTLIDGAGDAVCKCDGAALCRCGQSRMKPYCDGSHENIGFEES